MNSDTSLNLEALENAASTLPHSKNSAGLKNKADSLTWEPLSSSLWFTLICSPPHSFLLPKWLPRHLSFDPLSSLMCHLKSNIQH